MKFDIRSFWACIPYLLFCTLLLPSAASGHQTSYSKLDVQIRPETGDVSYLLDIGVHDVLHYFDDKSSSGVAQDTLNDRKKEIVSYFRDNLRIFHNGALCPLSQPLHESLAVAENRLHFRNLAQCGPLSGEVRIENRIMHKKAGGFRHFSRIEAGDSVHTTVFDPLHPTYTVHFAGDGADSQVGLVGNDSTLWIQNLGLDHLLMLILFLCALLLIVIRHGRTHLHYQSAVRWLGGAILVLTIYWVIASTTLM